MGDSISKARMRLWLRSERAFGLQSLPVSAIPGSDLQVEVAESPTPAEPKRVFDERAKPIVPMISDATGRSAPGPETVLIPPPSMEPFTSALLSTEQKRQRLIALDDKEVRGCTRCRLCESRTNTVFGEGDADAKIFFIGEGPGENEDLSGRPFVGRAGQLLDKMIAGMGLKREQVYIANIVKCRPPNNRVPAPDEVATCTPYLERQLEIIRPKVIVTLGLPSAKYMLNTKLSMGKLRGQWQSWRGMKLMPTFHPAYVLRSYTDEVRAAVWSDLKQVMAEVGLKAPKRAE